MYFSIHQQGRIQSKCTTTCNTTQLASWVDFHYIENVTLEWRFAAVRSVSY